MQGYQNSVCKIPFQYIYNCNDVKDNDAEDYKASHCLKHDEATC